MPVSDKVFCSFISSVAEEIIISNIICNNSESSQIDPLLRRHSLEELD